MAIIRCPACDHRVSSKARACPYCHEPIVELTEAERERLLLRRWRDQLYRARNATYLAMTAVVVGMIWWWLAKPQGLSLPIPTGPSILLGIGVAGYICAWVWLGWLRFYRKPR